jgi:YidC/Oxa1 family membrane protein insertase
MPSQTRNWILFFLCFILIFGGYNYFRSWMWPGLSKEQRAGIEETSRILAATMPGGSIGDAARIAAAVDFNRDQEIDFLIALRHDQEEQKKKEQAAKKAEPPKPVEPIKQTEPAKLVKLGGEGYRIAATLTSHGAGVFDLTLTSFEAADSYGRPAKGPDGKPLPLRLIPPADTTSFAIYHYATADKDEEHPRDTLGIRNWKLEKEETNQEEQRAVFSTELPEYGLRLFKTFTLKPGQYHLGLTVRIERLPGAKDPKPFRYQLAGGRELPIEGVWYTSIFRNAFFDWVKANGGDERNMFDSRGLSITNGTGGSDRLQGGGARLQYAAVADQYFTSAIAIDNQQATGQKSDFIEFVRATVEGEPDKTKPQLDDITVRAIAEPIDPKPGEAIEHRYVLYHGPVKVALLNKLAEAKGGIDAELTDWYANTLHLKTLTDYGRFGWWSDFIILCTNAVHWLIGVLRMTHLNDAICIVLTTVLVRLAMMPVSRRQQASMARTQEGMAKLKPDIAKINEKYKSDVLAKQQATMELYRKHGINPAAGLGGCLMLLLQMPIFLGLYFALQESFFFRLEKFLWIENLAAPDMLFWWSEKIPFISEPASMGSFFYLGPYFNLLPVVSLTLMFIQMKYMQPPPADEQMAQQQKMMQYIMIPMFAFIFYKMPSGLCLYFIATTLWGLIERKYFVKKKPASPAAAAGENGRPRGKAKAEPEAPPGRLRQWWRNVRQRWQKLLDEAAKDPTQRRRDTDEKKKKKSKS